MVKVTRFGEVVRFDLARTLLGKGRYWTTAYYFDGTMIDTGCPFSAEELVREVAGIPVGKILNTHSHEDHFGANRKLQRSHPEIQIFAHHQALEVMSDPRRTQPLHPYRRVLWGWPDACQGSPLQEGDTIRTAHSQLQVLYTPGHSRDHLCFLEPARGWLFSGDLFVGGKDRALRSESDIWQIIASLQRVAGLNLSLLFPGSARVRENPQAEIGEKIAYLEDLGSKVLDLNAQGRSAGEIVRELCGPPMPIEYITLGHFSRKQLVLSYLRNPPLTPPTESAAALRLM